MNEAQKYYIKKFADDAPMSSAVYELIRNVFLKRKKINDVPMLAAERLALFLLEDAWKEIERSRNVEEKKEDGRNVGL